MKNLNKFQTIIFYALLFATSMTFAQKQPVKSQQIMSGQTPKGINDAEWASVQTQMELGKYRNYADKKGGYASANPNNGFHIAYQADGSTQFSPYEQTDTDYSIRFKLKGVGYQKLNALSKPKALHNEPLSDGSKLTYQWNNNLTEWWTNRKHSTEQWFSLQQAPQGKTNNEPLRLRLGIKTDMKMKVQAGQLSFSKANKYIQYNKLKAWDAKGKTLDAHFAAVEGTDAIDLVVADQNATYPITIDPSVSQQVYVKASNAGASDAFGRSVAIDGNTMVVGAIGEASNATGVNGNQSDNSLGSAGAAYVFVRSGTTWTQQAYLKASNPDFNDRFGWSVAISGETIVVGAHEDSNATGIGGDQTNNSALDAGAAYVFVRSGTTWTQQAYLKASNTGTDDFFGYSVSISGETIVVGANRESSNATGINGDQTNNLGLNSGAAYVFVRSGTTWTQQAYLKASNTGGMAQFGYSVAISGETIVVGAWLEHSNATGVNGDQNNFLAYQSGAAYVFVRSGTTWTQQAYLKASNTRAGDWFGSSVAISGETIVVGSIREGSNATGVNGDQTNNLGPRSGAAYVFVRSGTTWTQQAYLKPSYSTASYSSSYSITFGYSVGIAGDVIVVAGVEEPSNATGVDGDQTNSSADLSGAAYVFTRSGTTWSPTAYLKASNTGASDHFGWSAAISGQTIVIGAPQEDSNATGINGDQNNNLADYSGAAYVFTMQPPLTASTPTAQTATTNQAKTGNAATELAPTGGTSPYTYSNGSGDAACVAPSGATALTGLTVNANGTYSYTAPTTAGTYYYCIKVCDSATPTASCIVKNYTLTVAAGGSGSQMTVSMPTTCGCGSSNNGTISNFNCGTATPSPVSFTKNTPYTGTVSLAYTGGNGGTYGAGSVASTGVTGFTATWAAGTLATGAGSININITGTATIDGQAAFQINIAGQNCNIILGSCGAYVAAGQWKVFLCHNLGANISLDPHDMTQTNAWGLQGAYIQWGKRGPNTTGDSRVDWQNAPNDGPNGFLAAPTASDPNTGYVYNWDLGAGSAQPAEAWITSGGAKTVNDPCPTGYRVPTSAEWTGVNNNNTISRTGTWQNGNSYCGTCYGVAAHYGPNASTKLLTLPTSGYFDHYTYQLIKRGQMGHYWSSTHVNATNANTIAINEAVVYPANANQKMYGFPVRCIAE